MAKVVVQKIADSDINAALESTLGHYDGIKEVFPSHKPVWIKPNAVHYGPEHFTGVEFLRALFSLLKDGGVKDIHLADNCTAGNFTRLVFHAAGYVDLCKEFGVEPVFLDEEPTLPVTLGDEGRPIRFPKRLYRAWIEEREGNVYLSAPKFKTHSMTTLTLAVKGQQGLIQDADKLFYHNYGLHKRLARIYWFVRPDFVLVDAQKLVYHGHFPARTQLERTTADMGLVIGGDDAVAVDTVGAKIMGYSIDEVEHLNLLYRDGLGEGDINEIEVIGDISGYTERYPCTILEEFPPGMNRICGSERACIEGCRGNSEAAAEYLYNEVGGNGGFNLVCGKGFAKSQLEGLKGDFIVAGPCAVLEVADTIKEMYPNSKVYIIEEHNDLARITGLIARLMKPKHILKASPLSPLTTLRLFFGALRKKSRSRVARPF